MLDELHNLSQSITTPSMHDAKQISNAVNRRLEALLHTIKLKLYWREEAEDGQVILNPLAYIDDAGGKPQKFQLDGTRGGALSWTFQNGEPLWIEEIQTLGLPNAKVKNRSTGRELPSDFLIFDNIVESTVVIPLVIRGDVYGVYSFELSESEVLTPSVIDLLTRLGSSLALIVWNADTNEFKQRETSDAINNFLNQIREFSFDPMLLHENYRNGFIARPFEDSFAEIEKKINEQLEKKGIEARHYEPTGQNEYIIDEIMKRIRTAHFCIADITGSNPNVLAEEGMMMILGKNFLLIRKRGDDSPPPFNLNQYPVHDYELTVPEGNFNVWAPGQSRFQSFSTVLDMFTSNLPQETGFSIAKKLPSLN